MALAAHASPPASSSLSQAAPPRGPPVLPPPACSLLERPGRDPGAVHEGSWRNHASPACTFSGQPSCYAKHHLYTIRVPHGLPQLISQEVCPGNTLDPFIVLPRMLIGPCGEFLDRRQLKRGNQCQLDESLGARPNSYALLLDTTQTQNSVPHPLTLHVSFPSGRLASAGNVLILPASPRPAPPRAKDCVTDEGKDAVRRRCMAGRALPQVSPCFTLITTLEVGQQ